VLQKVAAQQARISEEELEVGLTNLVRLLPDIEQRIGYMKVEKIMKLMDEKEAVARRLLALKLIFPSAGSLPPLLHYVLQQVEQQLLQCLPT
jgi:hypothetical protein